MGALIMTHSDDNGLVLPPHLAPIQVVIVPIYKNDEQLKQIDAKVEGIVAKLKALGISVNMIMPITNDRASNLPIMN